MRDRGLPDAAGPLRRLKAKGFSDARLAALAGKARRTSRRCARRLGVHPVYKRIDTCAAEFASPTAYLYSTYEVPFAGAAGERGRAQRPQEGDHPRRRPEPHRPGHRVRLLLLPRLLRARRCRLRVDHGQLQPGDRVDRLRHLRPALFRAADGGGRARDRARRAVGGHAAGVIVQFGGQTPLKLASALAGGQGADPRHLARHDRPRRGPRPLPEADRPSSACASRRTASPIRSSRRALIAGELGLPLVIRPSYVLGGRAMEIVRDEEQLSDYLLGTLPELVPLGRQGALPQRQDRADQHRARQEPAAVRPLPVRRDRGRRRCARRRQGRLHRRHHGAHRGGRHPFRRLRLLAAAPLAVAGGDRGAGAADRADWRWRSKCAA